MPLLLVKLALTNEYLFPSRYPSLIETDDTIIISGHYDSRGSFGSLRAPGGDDDGSGTTGILSIARTIARKGVQFYSNVELCTFAGEEQGLLGSRAYARKPSPAIFLSPSTKNGLGQLRAQNASVVLMIQADMTAYRAPEEPMQLGLPATIGTPEVTDLVAKISALYSPELTVGYSSVSYCPSMETQKSVLTRSRLAAAIIRYDMHL